MCVSHNHPANPGKEAVELGVDYALFVFHRKMWSSFLCFSACFGRFNGANDCVSPTLKPTESADIFKAWMTPTVSGFEGLFGFTWSLFFCFCYCYLTAPLNVPAEAAWTAAQLHWRTCWIWYLRGGAPASWSHPQVPRREPDREVWLTSSHIHPPRLQSSYRVPFFPLCSLPADIPRGCTEPPPPPAALLLCPK